MARFSAEDEVVKSSVLNVNEKQWEGIRGREGVGGGQPVAVGRGKA